MGLPKIWMELDGSTKKMDKDGWLTQKDGWRWIARRKRWIKMDGSTKKMRQDEMGRPKSSIEDSL